MPVKTERALDPSIFSLELVGDHEEQVWEPLGQGSSRSWMCAGYGERARHVVDGARHIVESDAAEGNEERGAAGSQGE